MDNKAQWSLVAAAWVLAIGVIGLGVYAIRHFSALATTPPGQIREFGTAAKPLCPVDRDEIVLTPDTPKVSFNGTVYYFCDHKDPQGRSHKTLFLMDPLLYLTGTSSYAQPTPLPGSQPAPATSTAAVAVTATATPAAKAALAAAPTLAPSPTRTETPVFAPY